MAPPNSTESWRHHFRRGISDVLFIIVIVLSFLLLLILFGYHNTDPGWSTSGAVQEDTKHFLGIIGAYIADALFSALGYAAYLLPLGLSAISWQGLRRSELDAELMAWKGFALVIAMIALCGVLSLHATTPINSLAVTGGGLAGQKITIELLRIWPIQLVMGIYTLLFFIGITLLLETNWLGVLEWIGKRSIDAYHWLWRKIDGQTQQPTGSDAPYRRRLADPEDEDGDDTPARTKLAARLRAHALAAVAKYRAQREQRAEKNRARPQRTPTFQKPPQTIADDDLPPFRAPSRHAADEPPVRSEPNISWAHYKAQIAPEEPVVPPPAD